MFKQLTRKCFIQNVRKNFKRQHTSVIFSGNIVNSGYPELEIPKITLPEFLDEYHLKFEKYTAVECCETKRKYTYGEIRKKSTNLAKALKKIFKLHDEDMVAILLNNIPEYLIADQGIIKGNFVCTTVSPHYTPDEISKQLLDSEPKVIITEVTLVPTVRTALQLIQKHIPIITVKTKTDQTLPENTIDFHELVDANIDHPDIAPCSPHNVTLLPYSSGTTGLPKGVELTHINMVSNILQHYYTEQHFKMDATETYQEVIPTVLPFYHMFGHNMIMYPAALCGGKLVTLQKFSVEAYIKMLRDYQNGTMFHLTPPLVLLLIGNENIKKSYVKELRNITCGGAPLPMADEKRFGEKFGDHINLLQGYGLSEASPLLTFHRHDLIQDKDSIRGSVGLPIANTQIKIVDIEDPQNTPLGPNVLGELLAKGPNIMKGYRNLPEETKKAITEDGWLRTGDQCYYNEKGYFFVKDRFKELIKVKGYQVAPAELEATIRSFPGVSDAAVIGIPHDISGEVPRAYVMAKNGHSLDTAKLNEFMGNKLAKYKRLEGGIVVVDEIPKSVTGKILRRKIKEEYLKSGK